MTVAENIQGIKERIETAALSAGRKPEDITLVAVTKTVDAATAQLVLDAGEQVLGENRVQSYLEKYEVLGDKPRWHIIGHLQTNKVKYIVGKVELIHSVDSFHLAEEINKKAAALGITQDVLIQFNISGEESKSGAEPEDARRLFEELAGLSNLSIRGLMTMGPLGATGEENRRVFAGLRELFQRLQKEGYPNASFELLSMGMSGDFEEAIKEGANVVRVGSALFR